MRLLLAVCVALLFVASASTASPITWVNGSGSASEADFVLLDNPSSFTVNAGATTPEIFARIFESGKTAAAGANALITAYVGYGAAGSNPLTDTSWLWF